MLINHLEYGILLCVRWLAVEISLIYFPSFVQSGTCNLREAVIIGSIIEKVSIPMLHSRYALIFEHLFTQMYKLKSKFWRFHEQTSTFSSTNCQEANHNFVVVLNGCKHIFYFPQNCTVQWNLSLFCSCKIHYNDWYIRYSFGVFVVSFLFVVSHLFCYS